MSNQRIRCTDFLRLKVFAAGINYVSDSAISLEFFPQDEALLVHDEADNGADGEFYLGVDGSLIRTKLQPAKPDPVRVALSNLLNAINIDKDSGYFICDEAADIIAEARKALE